MPYSVVLLGVFGLFPFFALPLLASLGLLSIGESARYFIQYSAVLLSFFGGIYWWDALQKNAFDKQIYIAMLPTIVGWLCLVFSGDYRVLGVLSLSYLAVLVYDKKSLVLSKEAIVSYITLRMGLTTIVVLCHAWLIFLLD
ncbi:DUF3429 domain-containing protein [Aestuariibacter sp. A3R04]|uniref:DUF3429 domain-containing protein n=1 Tax=Aestuariibacter sp. A3R04 TaxID=2841571 RepID=UPI001C0944EB|nr:DUF3429 domain-containing protein [Aestuariibacter sp. A3R04]MBU3022983.1 DUF3429 domain-containing protein [Aestuariibacter sp. A3R04]